MTQWGPILVRVELFYQGWQQWCFKQRKEYVRKVWSRLCPQEQQSTGPGWTKGHWNVEMVRADRKSCSRKLKYTQALKGDHSLVSRLDRWSTPKAETTIRDNQQRPAEKQSEGERHGGGEENCFRRGWEDGNYRVFHEAEQGSKLAAMF